MVRSTLIPVWAAIIFLAGMFLMGHNTWPPQECIDNDWDGYGSPGSVFCTYPEGDCDDDNAYVHPGAPELCDGRDNQCLGDPGYGEIDEGCMAAIPGGCFDMGDSFNEGETNELPVHNVCITAFEIDMHEVTNAEYKACVDKGACTAPLFTSSYTRPSYYGYPDYDNYPVIYVAWYQAEAYCTWAGKRLPTEAEWEYAARGGLARKRFPWGGDSRNLEDDVDCDDACYARSETWNACRDYCHNDICDNDTHPVESYSANGYGLYDVAGNVWEWVNDKYGGDYYQYCVDMGIVNDPPGPEVGFAVFRSGSWVNLAAAMRVAQRGFWDGGLEVAYLGFRCARGGAYGP